MSNGRILIADDEPSVRDSVGYALRQEGFDVTLAVDGDDADAKLENEQPGFDLLILDIMMPGRSGLDICRDVRGRSPVPIILLTAKDAEVDKVVGLEVGADDYVTKPYRLRELVARMRAVLRRRQLAGESATVDHEVIRLDGIELDTDSHEVRVRDEVVNLPLKEFELLSILMENAGRVLHRSTLIDRVWGSDYVGDTKTLDVHVKRLRSKIEDDPSVPVRIVTIRGLGYKYAHTR
jgi:two-component system, OmpR family, response regulator RegX3